MNFEESCFLKFLTSQGTGKEQKIVMWIDRLGRKYSPLLNPEWLWKTLQSVALTFECIVEISFCDPSHVTTSAVFSHGPDCFVCNCSFWVWRKCYGEMLWCDHANRTSSSTVTDLRVEQMVFIIFQNNILEFLCLALLERGRVK